MTPDLETDKTNRSHGCADILKRTTDLCCATFGLLALSPLLLIIYVILKCHDDGPAFFHQERIGRYGRPFCIHKFRTMRLDAEAHGPQLAEADDARLTNVGHYLRKHHLDELPQLWNVLVGEMSMVGPRPERRFFIEQIMAAGGDYLPLLQLRPGVTSEATLTNGYTNTMEKMLVRLEMDKLYLSTQSWHGDFKIMWRTVFLVFKGEKKRT